MRVCAHSASFALQLCSPSRYTVYVLVWYRWRLGTCGEAFGGRRRRAVEAIASALEGGE